MLDLPTIILSEQYIDQVPATSAKLFVKVSGCKIFTGTAALKQAEEVRTLIERLGAEGIPEENVSLSSVFVDISKGLFSRSSSATYRLGVRCQELELLANILDVVSSQKNCRLEGTAWQYEGIEERKAEWLGHCITAIQKKAGAMARALNVSLDEVVCAEEQTLGERKLDDGSYHGGYHGGMAYDMEMGVVSGLQESSVSVGSSLDTRELAPSREMGVQVKVTYRISGQ